LTVTPITLLDNYLILKGVVTTLSLVFQPALEGIFGGLLHVDHDYVASYKTAVQLLGGATADRCVNFGGGGYAVQVCSHYRLEG